MKLVSEYSDFDMKTRIVFEFSAHELASLDLDPLDRALLADKAEQPADTLLKAEMIARRIHEQRVSHNTREEYP